MGISNGLKKEVILGIILFIVAGAAFYLTNYRSVQTQDGKGYLSKYDETTIPKVINDFYENYESCLKNPPAQAAGRISVYCQNNSELATVDFGGNLEKGGVAKSGADPVFCAQSMPETRNVSSDFQVKNDKATGFMEEKFGSNEIKVQVELINEKGIWKVDNVICPAPVVGGDRDEHGCIGSAGYTWCEEKQKCLRIWEESCNGNSNTEISMIVGQILAKKYNKPVDEVNVTVQKADAAHAAGSVLFGAGGPGEGGLFLAVKTGSGWRVVFDGNGNVDCDKMRTQYNFTDAILKPNFCN